MEGNLPQWAQIASVIAIALISTVVGVFKYLKTEAGKVVDVPPTISNKDTAAVVAATFTDSRLMRELIDELKFSREDADREGTKTRRSNQELRETMQDLSEAIQVNTDTSLNMIKFVKARDRAKDLEDL